MTARLEEAATMTRPPHTPETCPTCGGATTTSPALALGLVTLGPVARDLFDALYRARGWVEMETLRRSVWDGYASRYTVHGARRRMAPVLAEAGWRIESNGGNRRAVWRLVRIEEAAA
jgi:hypothetical protein